MSDKAFPGYGQFIALLAAVLALRLAALALSNAELYPDEAQYWAWGQDLAFGYFSKPPLIAWIARATTAFGGDTEFWVRVCAPVLHFVTSLVIYRVAQELFDHRTGIVAGTIYAIMPGTSLSSILLSTDVPLLLCWSVGLWAIVRHVRQPSYAAGIGLGLAIGLGLNAKYAMIYLPLCLALYVAFTPGTRAMLRHPATWLGIVLAVLLILPNLWWNAANAFATFEHTRSNAGWSFGLPKVGKAIEFIGAQIGIIGPVPFAAVIIAAVAAKRAGVADGPRRLLLFHSMPVFAAILLQALIAGAHGNWAATGFPAAVVLASAVMLAQDWRRGIVATWVISAVVLVAVSFSGLAVGRVTVWPIGGELSKLTGWGNLAADVRRVADQENLKTVVFGERMLTASMVWELRDSGLDVRALLPAGRAPGDHFEMTVPWEPETGEPALVILPNDIPRGPLADATEISTFPTAVYLYRKRGGMMVALRSE